MKKAKKKKEAVAPPPLVHPDDAVVFVGVKCPACGCGHAPVWYTRNKKHHIFRVRVCRHCGRKFTTRETAPLA